MRFQIYNVGHGFCAEATARNGRVVLFDCGHSDSWRPSAHFNERLSLLAIGNYDEDHISDLPGVRRRLGVDYLVRNTSISGPELRSLKLALNGELSQAMRCMVEMMDGYTTNNNGQSTYNAAAAHDGVGLAWFWNKYRVDFDDTNNLSVVTFVQMGDTKFVLPGDMERPGWERLLREPGFCQELAGVNVFVASHHGRESGYCESVFRIAKKVRVVIISDEEKKYEAQEMAKTYAQHASGVRFNGEQRNVLTTRSDGTICWNF